MAADNVIETVLVARDEASAKIGLQLELFNSLAGQTATVAKRTSESMGGLTTASTAADASFGKTARSIRALALPLASELAPAFGQTSAQIVNVIASSALLGGGLTAVGIAAAGLAGIVAGRLVESYQQAAKATKEFNAQMASFDPAVLTAGIEKQIKSLDDLNAKIEETTSALARAQSGGGFGSMFGDTGPDIDARASAAATAARDAAVTRAQELVERRRLFEQGVAQATAEADAEKQIEAAATRRAQISEEADERRIASLREAALAAIAAEKQIADARAQYRSPEAVLQAELARIERIKAAELAAIEATAAVRRQAIARENAERLKAGIIPTEREELEALAQTTRERRLAAERELAKAVAAAHIEAARRVAAEQQALLEQTLAQIDAIIAAAEAANQQIRASDRMEANVQGDIAAHKAGVAREVFLRGGTVTVAEMKAIRRHPDVIAAMGGPTGAPPPRAGAESAFFQGIGPGGERAFSNAPGAAAASGITGLRPVPLATQNVDAMQAAVEAGLTEGLSAANLELIARLKVELPKAVQAAAAPQALANEIAGLIADALQFAGQRHGAR